MQRAFRSIGAVLATCAVGVAAAGSAAAATGAQTALTGSAPSATASATDVGAVAATQPLQIQVWLTPDEVDATAFDNAVSTPGNLLYHAYLSPAAYTTRFGPTAAEAQDVSDWLTAQGFTGVQAGAQRDDVTATGTAATINQAFSVQMDRYQIPAANGTTETIISNDQDLSVPTSISADVLSVTGLNSTQPTTFHTATSASAATSPVRCSSYWDEYTKKIMPAFDGLSQAAVSVCGYSADQLRAFYGQNNANTGVGQTVALIEVGVPTAMFQTLADYASSNGLPAPKSTQFREEIIGQGNTCGNEFDIEEQLDSEATYAMAPGANQLMVDGDSCNEKLEGVEPLFDAELAVLDGNGNTASASIESNSWGLTGGESFPKIYANTAHAINLRATAEGVGMYFSSGDNPGISVPASDPYSLSVGGTTVGVGQANNRVFETGWSNDDAVRYRGQWDDEGIGRDAAGGGVSLLYPQPSYQVGVVPPTMSTVQGTLDRTVPDVAADADPNSGILQGVIEPSGNGQPGRYQTFPDGGTSLASPLVAGMVADAQQGQAASYGFINPLLYSLSGTSAFHDTLPVTDSTPQVDRAGFTPAFGPFLPSLSVFDSQLPAYTSQVTAPGYDTMTGLGTPNGEAFIYALRSGS